jgi:predicted small lipoprotein YifL
MDRRLGLATGLQSLYGAAAFGDTAVKRPTRPASLRAILVLTVAGLALAGCGRKGSLDLPPQSSARPLAETDRAIDPDYNSAAGKGSALFGNPNAGDDKEPVAARGRKKSFVLDPLLD